MYIVENIYRSNRYYTSIEEAEKQVQDNIDYGCTVVIAKVIKAFQTEPIPYKSVDIAELKTKQLIEQDK